MIYECPRCKRYGMEWDGRGKILMCHFSSCNHVIRIPDQKSVPNHEKILRATKKEK